MKKEREKKKFFKNKVQMVSYIIIFIICIILFIVIGSIDFDKLEETDAVKFNNIYSNVSKDNRYHFATATDVLNIIQGRSGIVLFGFPENEWTKYYAEYLEEVAKENDIDEINYYDFLRDRENSNGTYETIINHLSDYVPTNDLGVQNIQAPTILIVKNGNILLYLDDESIIKGSIKPESFFNQTEIDNLKEEIKSAMDSYKGV